MKKEIERIVSDFEQGLLDRRTMIAGLAALFATASRAAGAPEPPEVEPSTFTAVGLNHLALGVPDVARSRDFYVRHLGLKVTRESGTSCFLSFGNNFLALFQGSNPGMHHYCYSVEGYQVDEAARKLRSRDLQPRIQGNRIYFDDPDGLTVQLAAPDHRA